MPLVIEEPGLQHNFTESMLPDLWDKTEVMTIPSSSVEGSTIIRMK